MRLEGNRVLSDDNKVIAEKESGKITDDAIKITK